MRRLRSVAILLAGILCLAVWLRARSAEDDRSEIIVRSGSIIIDNGGGTVAPTPWTHDTFLNELKPADNNFEETTGFAVSFESAYAACGAATASGQPVTIPPMSGNDVLIDFSYTKVVRARPAPTVSTVHFHLRKAHLGGLAGKNEPKLDDLGFVDTSTNPPPAVQQLQTPLPTDAYISRVLVAGAGSPCTFPAPPDEAARRAFRVHVQPKTS